MTYRSRGRSIIEVIIAVTFVSFLVGFIAVLCIGNYFRAKRAMERQAQRRKERDLMMMNTHSRSGKNNTRNSHVGGLATSYSAEDDESLASSVMHDGNNNNHEQQHLLGMRERNIAVGQRQHMQQKQQQQFRNEALPSVGISSGYNLNNPGGIDLLDTQPEFKHNKKGANIISV